MLDERKNTIKDSLESAEANKIEANKLKEEYEQRLAEAKAEAQEIIAQATKAAEDSKNEIVAAAKEDANRMIEKAKAEIDQEKEKALAQVRDEVATLAVLAAGKILEKSITVEDHKQMVNDFIDKAGELSC